MAQEIDLSPRQILSYLRDLENKLPKRKYVEFDACNIADINTDKDLNSVARQMLDFVGLNNYNPQCTFCKTEEGVGGYTFAARNDNLVPISVSESYKSNKAAVLAVLAHEICHKVIYINGIVYQPPFDKMNEVFTDICTIYVGFGRLILNGYITTNKASTSYLGYLKYHVYKNAFDIVDHIISDNTSENTEGWDYFLEESFKMWHADSEKRKLFLNSFADIQDEFSRLTRDIKLLNQLLEQIINGYTFSLDRADEYYFRKGVFFDKETGELIKPIGAFSAIYENSLTKDHQELLQNVDVVITQTMLSLIDKMKDVKLDELKYQPFECPFCHTKSSKAEFEDRSLIATCPACHKHFHLNCEHWNYTKELGNFRRQEKERREELISQGRAAGEKTGYLKGLKHGRHNAVEAFIASLPKWLKWLVKRYN